MEIASDKVSRQENPIQKAQFPNPIFKLPWSSSEGINITKICKTVWQVWNSIPLCQWQKSLYCGPQDFPNDWGQIPTIPQFSSSFSSCDFKYHKQRYCYKLCQDELWWQHCSSALAHSGCWHGVWHSLVTRQDHVVRNALLESEKYSLQKEKNMVFKICGIMVTALRQRRIVGFDTVGGVCWRREETTLGSRCDISSP